AGDEGRLQTVSLRKLFAKDEGLCDVVLVTRDFREPAFSWERTAILAFRRDKTILHEFVSVDRKKLGQDRLRHLIASFWPVALRDDPTILSLMIADASAEFALPTGDSGAGKGAQGGILSLDVKVRFLSIDKAGEFKLADPAAGEAAKAIASVMDPGEGKPRSPLHWRLLLDFYLAERNREGGNTARAAAGYQSIVDTAAHALQTSSEELVRAPDDLRDPGAIAGIAKSRLDGMK
ncbi:MAG: hypothetical protein MUC63_00750, partial [Planctomycetes bacterium]|nr:hypothetical protein [Planctomycetota bacterium]